jgi:hypothetical protein
LDTHYCEVCHHARHPVGFENGIDSAAVGRKKLVEPQRGIAFAYVGRNVDRVSKAPSMPLRYPCRADSPEFSEPMPPFRALPCDDALAQIVCSSVGRSTRRRARNVSYRARLAQATLMRSVILSKAKQCGAACGVLGIADSRPPRLTNSRRYRQRRQPSHQVAPKPPGKAWPHGSCHRAGHTRLRVAISPRRFWSRCFASFRRRWDTPADALLAFDPNVHHCTSRHGRCRA